MTTVLRYQQRAGRFGRDVRGEDDLRTAMETDRADERSEAAAYVVDADAVAAAIIARLLAGRTIAPPPQSHER
jgi:hypothetical protein